MQSLVQIIQSHQSVLIIDASSADLQVGWQETDAETRWVTVECEAGTGLYRALAELDVDPNRAGAFVFCEGPGSMLGIRTVAAALRTWVALDPRPVFSYRSLDLAAHALGQANATLICDARRQSWHALTINDQGMPTEIRRVGTDDLPAKATYTLRGFRSWTPLPVPAPAEVDYDARLLTGRLSGTPLLQENQEPDAYQPERPTYAKWTPQVHQAPPS